MSDIQPMSPPWTSFPIPQYVRDEFARRAGYGIKYKDNSIEYRGPQTAWIRLCSNANVRYKSKPTETSEAIITGIKNGFIFSRGNTGFYEAYGINNNLYNVNPQRFQTIGYDRNGTPHTIDNSSESTTLQKFRPAPSITSIEIDIKQTIYRFAKINWKCYSIAQLEYMLPYFFTPTVSVILEWGWNNFNPKSLIDLKNDGEFVQSYMTGSYGLRTNGEGFLQDATGKLINNIGIKTAHSCPEIFEKNMIYSAGSYDGMSGMITSWNYSFNDSDNSFDCMTEISSASKFCNAMLTSGLGTTSSTDTNKSDEKTSLFDDWFEKQFEPIVKARVNWDDAYAKSELLKGTGDLTLTDRLMVFDPDEYEKDANSLFKGAKRTGDKKTYVSLKLFFDAINQFIAVKPNKNPKITYLKILCDVIISGHKNMISSDPDILIPNCFAPFYYPEAFLDSSVNVVDASSRAPDENLKITMIYSDKLSPEDKQIHNVLKSQYRQNINRIINYQSYGRTSGASALAFPSVKNTAIGNLQNIYISTDIVKSLTKEQSIEDLVKKFCSLLNNLFPKTWNLQPVVTNNVITIKDENYLDTSNETMSQQKKLANVSGKYLYYLQTFVKESVCKNFKFSVELKDSIASQIMNKVQHEQGQTQVGTTVSGSNKSLTPTAIDHALISSDKYDLYDPIHTELQRIDETTTKNAAHAEALTKMHIVDNLSAEIEKQKEELKRKRKEILQTIDDETVTFRKQLGDSSIGEIFSVAQLTLPNQYKEKSLAILENPIDTNKTSDTTPYGGSSINNSPMPDTSIEFTVLGIGGFKMFQIFAVDNLPEPYKDKVVFQVKELKHSIVDNEWNTTVVCSVRPIHSIVDLFTV